MSEEEARVSLVPWIHPYWVSRLPTEGTFSLPCGSDLAILDSSAQTSNEVEDELVRSTLVHRRTMSPTESYLRMYEFSPFPSDYTR